MNLGLLHRRLIAVMMALAIFVLGMPMLPANAATACDHMAMAASMPMAMDMKSMPGTPQKMPAKPGLPCNDGANCLGGTCAAPVAGQVAVILLPRMDTTDANWTISVAGASVAYKPALPPPILLG